jgi:hypothetical protein
MMKKWVILSWAGFLVPGMALAAKKKMGEDLSNMIIQGENRLRVEPRVPVVDWSPAPYQDVQGIIQDVSLLSDLTPPTIQEPPVVLPDKSDSNKTASPWLERVYQPPLLKLQFTPPEAVAKNSAGWTFLIKDSNGNTFYEVKGKEAIPKEMIWQGFSNKGEPLHVGFDYAFSFSALDEAGNPHRHAGKPFRVDAFRHKKGSSDVFSFQPEAVFEGKSSLKFSKNGGDYLAEVRDSLRRRSDAKVEVVCYEEDVKFAQFRSAAVRDWIKKSLDIPDQLIQAKGLPVSKGGGYRHVDVMAK